MLCITSHRQRHLETAPPFAVPCEWREARFLHRSHQESNRRPSSVSPLHYRCAKPAQPLKGKKGIKEQYDFMVLCNCNNVFAINYEYEASPRHRSSHSKYEPHLCKKNYPIEGRTEDHFQHKPSTIMLRSDGVNAIDVIGYRGHCSRPIALFIRHVFASLCDIKPSVLST